MGEENNGTTIAAMNLIRYLKKAGHEVRVLCPDKTKKDLEGYFVVPTRSFGVFNGYVVTAFRWQRLTTKPCLPQWKART